MLGALPSWLRRMATGAAVAASVSACVPMAPAGAIIEVEPPPPRVEVIPVRPSVTHLWIGGRWAWRPAIRRYEWVPGHWRVPAHPHHRHWIPGHWARGPGGWHYVRGHWR